MAFNKIQTRDLNEDFVLPLEKGGTGSTTSEEVLENLGIKNYVDNAILKAITQIVEASY